MPGMGEQKCSGAICALRRARTGDCVTVKRRLLIAGDRQDRQRLAKQRRAESIQTRCRSVEPQATSTSARAARSRVGRPNIDRPGSRAGSGKH